MGGSDPQSDLNHVPPVVCVCQGGVPSPEDALAALAAPFPEAPSPPAGPKRARAASPDARGGGDTKRPRPSSRRAGGLPPEAPAVKVDRECMMTAGQAEAVNDKLPKGFLYVPADDVGNSGGGSGSGGN